MTTTSNQNTQKFSFKDIFEKNIELTENQFGIIDEIIVPEIQRPYAYGRKSDSVTFVRNNILDELFETLKGAKEMELNFVYGNVLKDNSRFIFELLDGQQRLTTLFLLYWYIINQQLSSPNIDVDVANIDKSKEDEDKKMRSILGRFTYRTRATAAVFCKRLSEFKTNKLTDIATSPSSVIKRTKWYYKSFDNDSTIRSMLIVLDAIHERYCKDSYPDALVNLDKIQFYLISLGMYGLSEELYVKMNARGLKLTPFECFKADLTQFMYSSIWPDYHTQVPLFQNATGRMVEYYLNFITKIDAKWIDLFWNKNDDNYDDAYHAFFYRFCACRYLATVNTARKDMQDDIILNQIFTQNENNLGTGKYLGFAPIYEQLQKNPEYIKNIETVLDKLSDSTYQQDIIDGLVPCWDVTTPHTNDSAIYLQSHAITQKQLVLLSAVIEYLLVFDHWNPITYKQWMRVVWNIVENTDIDNLRITTSVIQQFHNIITDIAKQMSTGKQFYSALASYTLSSSDREALQEEVMKAQCINSDPAWEAAFIKYEKNPFLKGMVGFYFTQGINIPTFEHRSEIITKLFDESGITVDFRKDHILLRALVSQLEEKSLNGLFVTENNETHKHLKHLLGRKGHTGVHAMMNAVGDATNISDAHGILDKYIKSAPNIDFHNRLKDDVLLYDWLMMKEVDEKGYFKIYDFHCHKTIAIPYKWYAKVMVDTDRDTWAFDLFLKKGFDYCDSNQGKMYFKYKHCFGNDLWLQKQVMRFIIKVGFCEYHKLFIDVQCKSDADVKSIQNTYSNASPDKSNKMLLRIYTQEYYYTSNTNSNWITELSNLEQKLVSLPMPTP